MAATATTLKILIFDMAPSGAPRESNGSAFLRAEQPSRHDEVPHCFFDRSERNIDRKPALPTRLNRRRRFDGARNRRARSLLLSTRTRSRYEANWSRLRDLHRAWSRLRLRSRREWARRDDRCPGGEFRHPFRRSRNVPNHWKLGQLQSERKR